MEKNTGVSATIAQVISLPQHPVELTVLLWGTIVLLWNIKAGFLIGNT